MKVHTLIAGVNGAGKSTFYKAMNIDFGIRVNLDEIIKEQFNNDWDNHKVQMAAGRTAVELIRNCISKGISFNQETTLTGQTIFSTVRKAKANGFKINLYYVGLESVELSIERVAMRVATGGHGIPEEDLRRRYKNSFENLNRILPLCDDIQIYDNSGSNTFDTLNPLLAVKNNIVVLSVSSYPQYLKDIIDEFISELK